MVEGGRSCNTLTKTKSFNRMPRCSVSIKEYHGDSDIRAHLNDLWTAYKAMPPSCHRLLGTTRPTQNRPPPEWTRLVVPAPASTRIHVLVATVDGEPKGFAICHIHQTNGRREAHVFRLCAKPSTGCRGVGSALVEHMMTIALRYRTPYIHLESVENAVGFYKRLGFTQGRNTRGTSVAMKLNILWYFSCWLRSNLSANDQANIRSIFV